MRRPRWEVAEREDPRASYSAHGDDDAGHGESGQERVVDLGHERARSCAELGDDSSGCGDGVLRERLLLPEGFGSGSVGELGDVDGREDGADHGDTEGSASSRVVSLTAEPTPALSTESDP